MAKVGLRSHSSVIKVSLSNHRGNGQRLAMTVIRHNKQLFTTDDCYCAVDQFNCYQWLERGMYIYTGAVVSRSWECLVFVISGPLSPPSARGFGGALQSSCSRS